MKYIPKLHLACSTDDLRFNMQFVKYDSKRKRFIVTNGQILIEISLSNCPFLEGQAKHMKKDLYIVRKEFEKFTHRDIADITYNNEINTFTLIKTIKKTNEKKVVIVKSMLKKDYIKFLMEAGMTHCFYPRTNAVWPYKKAKTKINHIGIDIKYLGLLERIFSIAMGKECQFEFIFNGEKKGIIIIPTSYMQNVGYKVKILLMPVILNY